MKTAIGIFDVLFVVGGYVLSIYTWPWLRLKLTGASAEYDRLRARADAVISAIKR